MYGVAIGDLLGSKYEFNNIKTKDFELFQDDMFITDDTIMTCAVAETLLNGTDIRKTITKWYRRYPQESYGSHFREWVEGGCRGNQYSMGNGAAMRVSPVGWLAHDVEQVRQWSMMVTKPSHSHPDGLKGAEATAMMVFWAKKGICKSDLERRFKESYYSEGVDLDVVRADRTYWGECCHNTVPQAMECFFRSTSFEDCMRNCISIGGDSDTIGAIAGGVAEAYYGIPKRFLVRLGYYMPAIVENMMARLYEGAHNE